MNDPQYLAAGLLLHLITIVACLAALGIAVDAFVEYFTTGDVSTRTFWNFICAVLVSMLLSAVASRYSDQ